VCDVSIAVVVAKVLLPVAEAFTYGDGDAVVSAVHCGVPATAGPPPFTR
jgi:hypothetical protein